MPKCIACDTGLSDSDRFCPACGTVQPSPAAQARGAQDAMVGRTVAGKYQILSLLGVGGMGRVYKSRHLILDKIVVIKLLHEHFRDHPKLVKRFQREARAASRLSHPNSIQVLDFGQDRDRNLYMAMEYVEGQDVAMILHGHKPIPEERIIRIASQICAALADAHNQNIVHRDLKPENIMVSDSPGQKDFVKVLDFGIAKLLDLDETATQALTQAGSVCGTPEYMSPEQARGHELDGRSDIFALGVMLYQMATGDLPFAADTPMAVVAKNLFAEPEPPSRRAPPGAISPALEAVILKAMEKDREQRFQSATELAEALEAAARGEAPEIVPRLAPSVTVPDLPAAPAAEEIAPPGAAVPPRSDIRSSNLAIAFIDIVGFTERMRAQSREESAAWLGRFEDLVLPLVRALGGRKVKGLGDAYLCTFPSPTDAVLFGMAAQDRLFAYNPSVPVAERFEIRVAINTGEVREHQGDVFGEPVNVAARLEGLTPAGQVWFTEALYLAMTRSEVATVEVGAKSLKGIPEPVKVFRVPRSGESLTGETGAPLVPGTLGAGRESSYPFRGIGLARARARGWSEDSAGLATLLHVKRWTGMLDDLGARYGDALRIALGVVVIAALLALLAVAIWPAGRLGPVADAIDDERYGDALTLLETNPERDTPAGQILRARALLRGERPRPGEAAQALEQAITTDASLAADGEVIRDLVATLDRKNAQSTIALIQQHAAGDAEALLIDNAKSKSYWLRWNSIQLLEAMGEGDEVDFVEAYLLDLTTANSCSTRKRAAQKLAELKDARALGPLRDARTGNVFKNLCMGRTIDRAIKTIENGD